MSGVKLFDDTAGAVAAASAQEVVSPKGEPSPKGDLTQRLFGRADADAPRAVRLREHPTARALSLPATAAEQGLATWNQQPQLVALWNMMEGVCTATTPAKALDEIKALLAVGTDYSLLAYMYLRMLSYQDDRLYYETLLADPGLLLPIAYTPTVGEACQKFGRMPLYPRGCYVSLKDKGKVKQVLEEYAKEMLKPKPGGGYECQCMVFSDGGRILGLGDLGAWGMGIPIGKLDLYTVCGGLDPNQTVPVILDVGCGGASANTAKLTIRDHDLYTGMKQDRVKHTSPAGTDVNSCYYGTQSFVREFMLAATELFGTSVLLQFEDFNSNDAFPLLAEMRDQFLTYNDDIQGTAGVTVAGILGGVKLQRPKADLAEAARGMTFLFHGSGSANIGAAELLKHEFKVPASQIFLTGSRGLLWKSEDGKEGCFRNDEQKALASVGKPAFDSTSLLAMIEHLKPDALIGAVGGSPGCFTQEIVEKMCAVQHAKKSPSRPLIFALSNPKTQAEITAEDCYAFSKGEAIYGSGTRFAPVDFNGRERSPGQVNNFLIFPGMSFGAVMCKAKTIPEALFMAAAEAVANSLDAHDVEVESVVPHPCRIREVSLNVAASVVLKAQELGIAQQHHGATLAEVHRSLAAKMWVPEEPSFSRL